MGQARRFLEDEPNFLSIRGREPANRMRQPQSGLPRFHRDMYAVWWNYFVALIPHLAAMEQRTPARYRQGIAGQDAVLNELISALEARRVKASAANRAPLASELGFLKRMIDIERSTNEALEAVDDAAW